MPNRPNDRGSSPRWLGPLSLVAPRGLMLLVAFLPAGCSKKAATSAPTPAPSSAQSSATASPSTSQPVAVTVEPAVSKTFEALPVTMRVAQRSTTAVPGTAGQLSITVDDITRGQVMISLLDKRGAPIAGPASVKQDQAISFELGETKYAARVLELSNALVGSGDFVTIVIDRLSAIELPSAPELSDTQTRAAETEVTEKQTELTEKQKIERLIAVVAAQRGAQFIRNGTAYSATEAADHLRMKLENLGDRVQTAVDFIEKVASKSSVSGKEYLIELPDGRVLTVGQFLRDELAKLKPAGQRE